MSSLTLSANFVVMMGIARSDADGTICFSLFARFRNWSILIIGGLVSFHWTALTDALVMFRNRGGNIKHKLAIQANCRTDNLKFRMLWTYKRSDEHVINSRAHTKLASQLHDHKQKEPWNKNTNLVLTWSILVLLTQAGVSHAWWNAVKALLARDDRTSKIASTRQIGKRISGWTSNKKGFLAWNHLRGV